MTQLADKPSIDEVMAHVGIIGMKWGRRSGKGTTGISRSNGALIDRNARITKVIKDARSGKKYQVRVALGKKLIGEKQLNKNWNTRLSDIRSQDKRLIAGKITVMDRLDKAGNLGLVELGFRITPK